MSRALSATITAAIAQTDTKPIYLVQIGWSTVRRLATWDANISWNAQTWVASGIEVSDIDADGGTLRFPIDDNENFLTLIDTEGQNGITVSVWEYQTDFTASPIASDAVLIFSGVMDDATIGKDIRVGLIEDKKYKAFPPKSITQDVFTHLLPIGTVLIWRDTVITVE